MKKLSELLAKCSQFEELASFGIEPISFEHPTIPRAPPIPMEFRPTEFAAPSTVPSPMWDTTPTQRPGAGPTMRSPGMQPVVPDLDIPARKPVVPDLDMPSRRPPPVEVSPEGKPVEVSPEGKPVAPPVETGTPPAEPGKPPVTEPTKPGIKASDIKFDENGNVVVPKEWYNEKGKLVVDKRQVARAIYDARKAKIVGAKLDAAKAKTLGREMAQVNSMVKSIAFREKLPARAAVALLSAAALTAVYFVFSGKKPATSDPIKEEVTTQTVNSAITGSLEKPTPVDMSASIKSLKDALLFIRAQTTKEKQAIQSYSTLLDSVNSSIAKLSGTTLSLDSTSSAASYAAEVKKFDELAVSAIAKLEKLQNILRLRNDTDGFAKAKKVIDGLGAYVVAVDSARSIRAQG